MPSPSTAPTLDRLRLGLTTISCVAAVHEHSALYWNYDVNRNALSILFSQQFHLSNTLVHHK